MSRHNSLEVVILEKMEHDGPSSDEGLDIGVVILKVVRKRSSISGVGTSLRPT